MEPRPGIEPGTYSFLAAGYKAVAPPLSYRGYRVVGGVGAKISSTE